MYQFSIVMKSSANHLSTIYQTSTTRYQNKKLKTNINWLPPAPGHSMLRLKSALPNSSSVTSSREPATSSDMTCDIVRLPSDDSIALDPHKTDPCSASPPSTCSFCSFCRKEGLGCRWLAAVRWTWAVISCLLRIFLEEGLNSDCLEVVSGWISGAVGMYWSRKLKSSS